MHFCCNIVLIDGVVVDNSSSPIGGILGVLGGTNTSVVLINGRNTKKTGHGFCANELPEEPEKHLEICDGTKFEIRGVRVSELIGRVVG